MKIEVTLGLGASLIEFEMNDAAFKQDVLAVCRGNLYYGSCLHVVCFSSPRATSKHFCNHLPRIDITPSTKVRETKTCLL